MDLQTLSTLFTTTLSPDPNARKAAELEIKKISNEQGVIAALLQIISADTVDVATRQACAVWVKNRVYRCYDLDQSTARTDLVPTSQPDRLALRSSILRLIAIAPNRAITLQLATTLKNMITVDVPDYWPNLMVEIKGFLNSGDIREVHAGCVAALEVVRAFRYRQKSDKMDAIVHELFPSLVTVATSMLQTPPSASQDIPTMLHLILKTYKTSIILNLSTHLRNSDSLVPWGQLFFAVVNLQLPNEAVPADDDERERSEWWKAKKWAYAILNRLFHRYGNPTQLPKAHKKEYLTFAQHFASVFAPEIFNTFLRQVELFCSGQVWLSRKAQYQIFQYFQECLKPKATWNLIKPHFESLLTNFVFPRLIFTPAKLEMLENDPVEYVRLSIDEFDAFATPAAAASAFLLAAASNRTKTTFRPILTFINTVLKSNSPAPQRYGALSMTSTLAPWIIRHPEVKDNIEQFVLQHVTPEFNAPEGYMRSIACEVIQNMTKSGMRWSSEENLNANFRAVANALDDPVLPVRIQAVLALTELIQAHESVRAAVAPQVGKVVQDLLKLSDETDLESLNGSMEVMVEQFQEELLPVAVELTARLCEYYLRLIRETLAPQEAVTHNTVQDMEHLFDEEDDKTYIAMGVAKTIWTLICSVESQEILGQLQEIIIPVIKFTLENKVLDLFDHAYDIIDTLTFKTRSIVPNMWPILDLTYSLFREDAIDFLDEMLPSLDNFVSFGSDVISTRPDYKQMLVNIYTTAMTSEHLGENDRTNGAKLAEAMLLNLRGQLDDVLQVFIVTSLEHMDKANTKSFRLANLEVLVNCLLYNSGATLQIMESTRPGTARGFFERWFTFINDDDQLPRVHDKKLTILTLCSLMEVNPAVLPETLQQVWPGILGGILKVFAAYPQAVQARKELEEALAEDSDEAEDEGEILNFQDDDEDVWDENTAYLDMLASEGKRLAEKGDTLTQEGVEYEETEEESDDEDEVAEELGVVTPLDTVNPYTVFKTSLANLQANYPGVYTASTASFTPEQQNVMLDVLRIAENHQTV